MIAFVVLMKSFADNLSIANNDAANGGVGTGETDALARKVQRTLHEANVMFVHQLIEKGSSVGFRVERDHVVDLFAGADKANGQTKLARNRDDDPTLRRPVEFR